jgi:hypothetical protein
MTEELTWPPIHRCRRCSGPLHKTLWQVQQHPDCLTYGDPRPSPPAEPEDTTSEHHHQVPEPEPQQELPPIEAEPPLHHPTAEIEEIRDRNRWT